MTFYDFLLIILKFYTNYLHFDKSSLTFFFNTLLANFIIRNKSYSELQTIVYVYLHLKCNTKASWMARLFQGKGERKVLVGTRKPIRQKKNTSKTKKIIGKFCQFKISAYLCTRKIGI